MMKREPGAMKTKLFLLGIAIAVSTGVILNGRLVAQQSKPVSSEQINQLKGLWVSERGSTFEIEGIDEESGEISGWFKSSTGTDGKAFPVVGFLNLAEKFPGASSYGHIPSASLSAGARSAASRAGTDS